MGQFQLRWEMDSWVERNGSHQFLYIRDSVSRLTTRYNIRVERRILEAMSVGQLNRVIRLAERELKKRRK